MGLTHSHGPMDFLCNLKWFLIELMVEFPKNDLCCILMVRIASPCIPNWDMGGTGTAQSSPIFGSTKAETAEKTESEQLHRRSSGQLDRRSRRYDVLDKMLIWVWVSEYTWCLTSSDQCLLVWFAGLISTHIHVWSHIFRRTSLEL